MENDAPATLSLTDPETLRCPYAMYRHLLAEAPVHQDERTGIWVLSRYDDTRESLRSPAMGTGNVTEKLRFLMSPERAARMQALFEEKGWVRERNLPNYEGEEHREIRDIFERYLRASRVRDHDDWMRAWCEGVVDRFAGTGTCEIVSQFSEMISIGTLCHLLDADLDKIPLIRESMHAIEDGLSFTQDEATDIANAEKEIAAQHYFMELIAAKRARPDSGLLSAIVNTELPSGRKLTDRQLLTQIQFDLFMAGADTTNKAMTTGVALLARNPDVLQALQTDPDTHLRVFIEEVLRLEPPASGTFRVAMEDVTLHGRTIPAGSLVTPRIAAANLDERQFTSPSRLDLGRKNAATHMSFGTGIHACIGAPLARRELHWAFKALLERVSDIALAEEVDYVPSLTFRGIARLNITFQPRA